MCRARSRARRRLQPNDGEIAIWSAECVQFGAPLAVDLGKWNALVNHAQRTMNEVLAILWLRRLAREFESVRDRDGDVETESRAEPSKVRFRRCFCS